jgi:isoleucyl-tRNA synthetase
LTDRILVEIEEASTLKESITRFNDYICAEILADTVELVPKIANGIEIEVNDVPLKVFVTKKA